MTGGVLRGLLKRYGQTVCLHSGGGQEVQTRAFLQPVLDRREDRWQSLPTPLGEARRDRFLYLFGCPGLRGWRGAGSVEWAEIRDNAGPAHLCGPAAPTGGLRPRDAEE